MSRRHAVTNYDQIMRDRRVNPRSDLIRTWVSKGRTVSVMPREAAGVDGDWPWVASCDDHGELLCCATKASATAAAISREWCGGCRQEAAR